jgi:hypothetical protein
MITPACIKAMSILYRLVILMELLGYKGIDVRSNDKGGSIITLGMQGNKARMVKYLNSTVEMLIRKTVGQ